MKIIIILFVILFQCIAYLHAQEDTYTRFRKEMSAIEAKENQLRSIIWEKNEYSQAYKDSVYKEHQILVKDKIEFAKKSVRENNGDERFLQVLNIYVRNFLTLDEFDAELKRFTPEVQAGEKCGKYFEFIKYARLAVPGQACIDFELTGHDGKKFKLSDVLKKNKLVLVDFWASWCGACRATMPHLKKIYPVYKAEGLEVLSVSLDDKKEAWEKAYRDEQIPWVDGSNLLGWQDPLTVWYAIRGIPHQVLIGHNGIIIGSGFNQSGSLEKAIENYLQKNE